MKQILHHFKIFSYGIAMGAADVIPGVSGGTVAFILGIYDTLVNAIHEITSPTFIKGVLTGKIKVFNYIKSPNALFLMSLFSGIIIAILALSTPIKFLLENHPCHIWSFFFGLIIGSILIILKKIDCKNWKNLLSILLGSIGAYFLVGMVPAETSNDLWFIFISGALAITAMILPGISGSFILLILGKYDYILTNVHNFKSALLTQNWELLLESVLILGIFVLGIIVGLAAFIKLLSYLLANYHNITISLLVGFMAGSLRKIWPFKLGNDNYLPSTLDSQVIWAVSLLIIGLLIVYVIEFLSNLKAQKD